MLPTIRSTRAGGRWVRAGRLRVGDSLVRQSGQRLRLGGVRAVPGRVRVYNFTVAGLHTYFVGADAVLVHNSGPCPVAKLSRAPSGDAIQVTKDGVALPKGSKIPESYVENPNRAGSYGKVGENGKFTEKLRIDPATPAGKKGPNHSHYHLDGKGTHYSPRPGDKNPGF